MFMVLFVFGLRSVVSFGCYGWSVCRSVCRFVWVLVQCDVFCHGVQLFWSHLLFLCSMFNIVVCGVCCMIFGLFGLFYQFLFTVTVCSLFFFFFFLFSGHHRDLHSLPTRRSSDL